VEIGEDGHALRIEPIQVSETEIDL
jgi:hypothetical protein